ncbi:MAG TPA: PIN domain-containing protein [Variovorax sp.]|nr:PIN domain-containing protein [Variovorax sp.]
MAIRYLLDTTICIYIAKHNPASIRARFEQLTEAAAQHYGQIRSALERKGRPIGNNDLWIAAHACAEGWVLVTNNEREFSRVEGLEVENWV